MRALRPRILAPGVVLLLIVAAALGAPLIARQDPVRMDVAHRFAPSSAEHLLGTDEFGRDLFSRLVHGARPSLAIALGAVALAAGLGGLLGLVGGYFSGVAELLTVRVVDVILSFPPIVLALLFVTLLGAGVGTLVVAIGILYLPAFARLAYSSVLAVRRLEYVEAARVLGAGAPRILACTIVPNVLSPIIVQVSLSIPAAILLESGLSFLGLGVVPPTPSWGLIIRAARGYMAQDPAYLLWPCLAIIVTILAMNTLGDALRDALDPRLRR